MPVKYHWEDSAEKKCLNFATTIKWISMEEAALKIPKAWADNLRWKGS